MFRVYEKVESTFPLSYDWEPVFTFTSVESFKKLCSPDDVVLNKVSMLVPGQWKIINGYKWKREI